MLTFKSYLGCSPFFADLEFYDGRQLETRNGSLVITLDKRPFRGMEYVSLSLSLSVDSLASDKRPDVPASDCD